MATLLAEDIPLPPSHQSPAPDNEAVRGREANRTESAEAEGKANSSQEIPTDSIAESSGAQEGTEAVSRIDESAAQSFDSNAEGPSSEADSSKDATSSVDKPSSGEEDRRLEDDQAQPEEPTLISPAVANNASTAVPTSIVRPPTPSSRTSTPPLNPSAPKKFSSININKKFLSKSISPAGVAGSPAGGTKLGLSSTSPIPISSTSSRLLSTKLTTVPSNKSSASPNPPGSAGLSSPAVSPWAKPAAPAEASSLTEATGKDAGTKGLQHPAPTRARVLTTTPTAIVMGTGQGIGGSISKPAWRPVASEARRGVGLSRDFPTAKEVAEGKRAAQVMEQAKAAQNQAIIQGLNVFMQLDPNAHRWEDEDDDDEVIDFGDGIVYPHHEHPPAQPEPISDQPVSKSERFAEDFDRSWPRQQMQPPRVPPVEASGPGLAGLPKRPDMTASDRVLFNANSNRLEPPSTRQPPQPPQPTRLMSRSNANVTDRPLPPHMQESAGPGGRVLPPHMAQPAAPPAERRQPAQPPAQPAAPTATGRVPWSTQREERAALPREERGALPPQSAAYNNSHPQLNNQRKSFSQQPRPDLPPPGQVVPPTEAASTAPAAVSPSVDSQTAEMHTAAEKARLRRLAEEAERDAAAERARQRAREMEERFGKKEPKSSSAEAPAQAASGPPGLAGKTGITLAQRPQTAVQPPSAPQQPSTQPPTQPRIATRPAPPPAAAAAAPARNVPENRQTEGSWRRPAPPGLQNDVPVSKEETIVRPPPSAPSAVLEAAQQMAEAELAEITSSQAGLVQLKKEHNFDNMLARIQAAMAEARSNPSPSSHPEESPEQAQATLPDQSKIRQIQARPPLSPAIVEIFNMTRPDLPKSPPPAWRTYTVKLPKTVAKRPSIPAARVKAFEPYRRPAKEKNGFLSSYEPPIVGAKGDVLRSDTLLAQLPSHASRRFGRPGLAASTSTHIVVSISPRRLAPFQKKGKKKVQEDSIREEPDLPIVPVESLLDGGERVVPPKTALPASSAPSVPPSTSIRSSAPAPSIQPAIPISNLPVSSADRWKKSDVPTGPAVPERKSPVKTSQAAKAEKEGLFDGVGIAARSQQSSQSSLDTKPGVRFMVSSELEGDSLLDEVNKISLETVGEGTDEERRQDSVAESKTPGTETPKTPPSLSGARNIGTSPNGTSTPWSSANRSAQSQSHHDHVRSVWAQTPSVSVSGQPDSTKSTLSREREVQRDGGYVGGVNPATERDINSTTPMYPSLNAPSSADPPATKSAPNMAYPHANPQLQAQSQAQNQMFSPSNPTFGRNLVSPVGYGYASADPLSQAQQNQQLLAYQRANLASAASGGSLASLASPGAGAGAGGGSMANGYAGGQQAVWSPSAFGTGYGYSKSTQAGLEGKAYNQGADYRYAQAHSPQAHAHGHGHGHPSTSSGYGYAQSISPQQSTFAQHQNSYGRHNPQAQQQMYGYYGAPGQSTGRGGRFASSVGHGSSANGSEYYGMSGMEGGGYYGGLGASSASQAGQPQGGYAYGPASAAGTGSRTAPAGVSSGSGGAVGGATAAAPGGRGGKMW